MTTWASCRCQLNKRRVVLQSARRSPSQPLLQQLHWFPVRRRIDYKLAVLTSYKIHHTSTPVYLSRHIQPLTVTRRLRSSATPRVCKPTTRTNFADRAFRCSAPAVSNSLTADIVDSCSLPAPSPKKRGVPLPNFRPICIVAKHWTHQDTTWYGGRPQPRRHLC